MTGIWLCKEVEFNGFFYFDPMTVSVKTYTQQQIQLNFYLPKAFDTINKDILL